ncbi:hypothetical protein [Sulfurospirillum cavolei]|uniref:hypothetical protein n=1 Tax=Sulfurospirillum cavolei TaxID=366522 RepID=UPI0005A6118B|nr:hypothetical protein [Sulfurospirillum cavolei]
MNKTIPFLFCCFSWCFADSIYLDCDATQLDDKKVHLKFNVKVDEALNKITYTDDGLSYTESAIFSPDFIKSRRNEYLGKGDGTSEYLEINRETLDVKRESVILYNKLRIDLKYKGKCVIKKATKKQV